MSEVAQMQKEKCHVLKNRWSLAPDSQMPGMEKGTVQVRDESGQVPARIGSKVQALVLALQRPLSRSAHPFITWYFITQLLNKDELVSSHACPGHSHCKCSVTRWAIKEIRKRNTHQPSAEKQETANYR